MQKALKQFPITIEIPVQWGEMDAARHVNNLIYLRWGESARIKYFEEMDLPTSFSGKQGPILGWQDCKYIFPITYPDTAIIGTKVSEIKTDRFLMECHIFSKKHQRLAAITNQSIIPYDYQNLCKIEMPTPWVEAIHKLENKVV